MRPNASSEPSVVDALRMSPDAMRDLEGRLSFEGNRQGMAQESGPMHGAGGPAGLRRLRTGVSHLSVTYATGDSLAGVQAGIDSCLARALDRPRLSVSAPDVSAWSVQDHLEHLLFSDRKVLGWVSDALALPTLEAQAHFPRELGVTLLARGSIPRGRGPAPDFTLPAGLEPGGLRAGFRELRRLAVGLGERLAELDACLHTHPHHVLGHFTPAEWLRFLHLHHQHHDAIIRDILAA